ncbi:MAG: sensor histidine kinase [Lachnospiraceae bacterium]|nr:sensor histidine kinase [Lachnospiraceae bacterium]
MFKSFLCEMLISIIVFMIPMNKQRMYVLKFLVASGVALFLVDINRMSWMKPIFVHTNIMPNAAGYIQAIIYYGMHILIMTAIIYITVRASLVESIFVFSLAYATEHIAYCIRVLINYYTASEMADDNLILYLGIHGLVCVFGYLFMARPMTKDGHYKIDAINSVWMGIMVIFLVLVMSLISFTRGFQHIHAIYAIMACVLLLSMERSQIIASIEEEEFSERERLWEQKRMQYEISKDAMAVVNRNYHDIKHQIAAVNAMTDADRRHEALQRMEENIAIYDSVVHTENELLDTVLTEKRLACGRKHITMSCICDGKVLLFMDGLDLYTLMGNALDNAIEATEKLPENQRFVSVKIQNKVGMTLVEISNPINQELNIVEGKLHTTKKDKEAHGFGMRSMKEIVKRYDGILEYKIYRNNFVLRLIFQK